MPTKQVLMLGLAGVASAGLYLSVMAGPAFFLLQYLTQLPLLCVGLAFGVASVFVTALVSIILTAAIEPNLTIVFMLGYAFPTVLIVRQASLRRVSASGQEEWYPVGSILASITMYALSIFILSYLWFSSHEGGLPGLIQSSLMELLGALGDKGTVVSTDFMGKFLFLVPGLLGISWIIMVVINAALAQGLMSESNRIGRPKLTLVNVMLPNWLACLLAPSMVMLSFGQGSLGFVGGVMTLVLLAPFLFQGLGVVHQWSAKTRTPGMLMTAFYVILVIFQWPVLLVIGIGLADQLFDFRGSRLLS